MQQFHAWYLKFWAHLFAFPFHFSTFLELCSTLVRVPSTLRHMKLYSVDVFALLKQMHLQCVLLCWMSWMYQTRWLKIQVSWMWHPVVGQVVPLSQRTVVPLRILLRLLAVSHPRGLESSGLLTVLLYKVYLTDLNFYCGFRTSVMNWFLVLSMGVDFLKIFLFKLNCT